MYRYLQYPFYYDNINNHSSRYFSVIIVCEIIQKIRNFRNLEGHIPCPPKAMTMQNQSKG